MQRERDVIFHPPNTAGCIPVFIALIIDFLESQTEEVHLKIQDETDDVRRLLVDENKEAQS